jgi:hypothetical protein
MRPAPGGTPVNEGVYPTCDRRPPPTYSEVVMTTLIIKKTMSRSRVAWWSSRRLPAMSR